MPVWRPARPETEEANDKDSSTGRRGGRNKKIQGHREPLGGFGLRFGWAKTSAFAASKKRRERWGRRGEREGEGSGKTGRGGGGGFLERKRKHGQSRWDGPG